MSTIKGKIGDDCKRNKDCKTGKCDYKTKKCIINTEAIVLENKRSGRKYFKNFIKLIGDVSPIRMFKYKDNELQGEYVRNYYVSNSINMESINHIKSLKDKNFILCPVYEKVHKTYNNSRGVDKLEEFDKKDVKEIQLCITGKVNTTDNNDFIKAIDREMNEELGLKLDITKDHTYVNSKYKKVYNNKTINIDSCDLLVNIKDTKKIKKQNLIEVKGKDEYSKKVSAVIYSETLRNMISNLEGIDPEIFNNNDDKIIGFTILSVRDAKKFLGHLSNILDKQNIIVLNKITHKVSS